MGRVILSFIVILHVALAPALAGEPSSDNVAGCKSPALETELSSSQLPYKQEPHRKALRGRRNHKLKIDRRKRHYVTYVPKSLTRGPKPLVIVLHGALCNAGIVEWTCNMSKQADKDNFIVAYPEGTGPAPRFLLTWNAGSCCGSAKWDKVDDIKFLRAMIAELEQQYDIDRNRIYVAGVSNGGMMAYRAGCELSDVVAAIASVEGCMLTKCTAKEPVSVIAFHGTADSVIPYRGGTGKFMGVFPVHTTKVSDTIETWVKHNDCRGLAVCEQNENVVKELYAGGANGAEVCLFTVKGGRHARPGGRFPAAVWNKVPHDFSATEEMCKFFWEHPKQKT